MSFEKRSDLKQVVFETLKTRRQMINLNKFLSNSADSGDRNRFDDVISEYEKYSTNFLEYVDEIKEEYPYANFRQSTAYMKMLNNIHSRNFDCKDRESCFKEIIKLLDDTTNALIQQLDEKCKNEVQVILSKRQ